MKQLENLRWTPRWVSHLGCLKGCLDYLGREMSDAWLYGGTGHAFVINMHERVCPSGPTAWKSGVLHELGRNVGYHLEGVRAHPAPDALDGVQREAWDFVRRAIDRGVPCYGWEFAVAEYYVIHGYDEDSYHYSGPACDGGTGRMPWRNLGRSAIGMIEVRSVGRGEPASDLDTVRAAVAFAIEHAESSGKWNFPAYKVGLGAYEAWARSLQEATAYHFGLGYNAAVWAECRKYAAGFLREARQRLGARGGAALDQAAGQYEIVAQHLGQVAQLYPFSPDLPMNPVDRDDRLHTAAAAIERARAAEAVALERMREAAAQMYE